MDHILRSNRTLRRHLETHLDTGSWLTANTYETCAYRVVMSSLMKKFEEPDNATAEARRKACIGAFLQRNAETPTNIGYHRRKAGYATLTRMNEMRCILNRWFAGATYSLSDGWVGPGESFTPANGHTSAFAKLSREIEVTPNALPLLRKLIMRSYQWSSQPELGSVTIVPGNRVTTVRKNNEKDRVICTEPSGNMILQKALGCTFRRVYNKVTGRELNHVQDLHGDIVLKGHWNGKKIATIDLSAASDSISMLLVESVLPPWVVELIKSVRSPFFCEVEGGVVTQMYPARIVSTMGNGFTFELLTLIMSAACELTGYAWSVYGDDIIIEVEGVEHLTQTLSLLGFSINTDKSCVDVPQLESCGEFSFDGIEIRRYEAEWMTCDADVCSVMNKLLELHQFYAGLHDELAEKLYHMWHSLYVINHDVLPAGPNLDCKVDGSFMRVTESLSHYHKKPIRAWAQNVAQVLMVPPQAIWEVDALYFEPDVINVKKPKNSSAYLHVFYRQGSAPSLSIRNSGKWVRKVTVFIENVPNFAYTRAKWNAREKPQKALPGTNVEVSIPRRVPRLPA